MHFLFPTMLRRDGVSIPVAIHLLNRYRFKQVEWGAMELLRRALVVRSSRLRLEDLILLILRCIIIALIAFALARPFLAPTSGKWLGRSADVGAVIAVDASFSMNQRPGLQSRFDRAKEKIQQIASTLKPGSPMTLVLLGDRPRVLIHKDGYDRDRLENVLKEAAPYPEGLNAEAGLEEIAKLVGEHTTPIKECYIVSDAQATTWAQLSDRSRGLLQDLSAVRPVFFVPASVEGSENVAVTRFDLKSGLLRKGAVARYDVEVSNLGSRTQKNVSVSLMMNDVVVDQRVLDDLGQGQKVGVSMFVRFDKVGLTRLTAKIGPDELTDDNARYLVADIRDRTRILYVKAPSLENPKKEDKDYVVTALTPRPSEALSVDTVSVLDMPSKKLSDYQIVILANVPDLVRDQFERLFYFVKEEGGGLIVFLGDNVVPELYNASFKHKGEPLLPARIAEAQADTLGWPIEAAPHPLSRVLAGAPSEMLRDARVQRYFRLKLDKGGRAAVKLAERDEAIVAEKTLGQGRVILFAGAADRDWSNMVVESPLYPMLLHEAVTFLGRQTHEEPVTVSGRLSLPISVRADDIKKVIFQAKGGRPLSVEPIAKGEHSLAELEIAEQPGFYEVRTEPAGTSLLAAVNVDVRESRLQPLTGEGLRQAFQGLNVNLVMEGDPVETVVKDSRLGRDLRRELLMIAVAVLLIEGFLARWFTHRASAGTSNDAVAAQP